MTEIITIKHEERADLDPLKSGFAHGYGLFETIKLSGGKLAFWKQHWARLLASAQALKIDLECTAEAVLQQIRDLVEADELDAALIKLSLLRDGVGSRLFIYARPMPPVPKVARLLLDVRYPINERSLLAGHKSHNYIENIYLLQEARAAGYYDTLRVNTVGELTETTIGNIFLVVDGVLWTPALETGALPGVIRSALIALQPEMQEAQFDVELLQRAEAVFITNSSCGLLPVEQIEGEGLQESYASATHPLIQSLKSSLQAAEGAKSVKLTKR